MSATPIGASESGAVVATSGAASGNGKREKTSVYRRGRKQLLDSTA
jgi:hypothetical protein